MKRLLAAALALVLALSLSLPALAWETSPEKYASFDPDAWFSARAGELTRFQGGRKETYMEAQGITTGEEFRYAMFADWVAVSVRQPMDVTVTVNGVPVLAWLDFNAASPYAERGRILVSTPALEEPLGFTVERDEENRVLTCTKGDRSVTFTDGESAYAVTRDGKTGAPHPGCAAKVLWSRRALLRPPAGAGGGSGLYRHLERPLPNRLVLYMRYIIRSSALGFL